MRPTSERVVVRRRRHAERLVPLLAATSIGAGVILGSSSAGASGLEPDAVTLGDDIVYFSQRDDEHGEELWRSDGTAEGTVLVKDLSSTPSAVPEAPDGIGRAGPSPDAADLASALAPFVMEPLETGRRIGPWREVAHADVALPADTSVALHRLVARGNGLVSVRSACIGDDDCFDLAWRSTDAVTWTPAGLPGEIPQVVGVVRAGGGFVAGGYVGRRRWEASIWFSKDGQSWQRRSAPPVSEIYEIAGSGKAVVVQGSDDRLWVTTDLEDWRRLRRLHGTYLARGPGGFPAYRGGGEDRWAPTEVWRSVEGRAWTRVKLGRAGRDGNDEVGIFPLEDRWVLITEQPGPIFTSPRGRVWRPAPRPPFMVHGASWVIGVGDRVQAFGLIDNQEYGLWTWRLGKRSSDPRIVQGGFGVPIAWQGGYIAIQGNRRTDD